MAIDTEERGKKDAPVASASTDKTSKAAPADNNKKVIKIVLIVVGVVIVLAIIGSIASAFLIKKGTESFISGVTGGKAQVDSDKGEVTIKGENGSEVTTQTSNAEIPDGYPTADVPVYENAHLESSSDMHMENMQSYTLRYTTDDNAKQVVKFYKSELSGDGWKNSYSTNSGETSMASFMNESKDMSVTVSATDNQDDGKTSLGLSVRITDEK